MNKIKVISWLFLFISPFSFAFAPSISDVTQTTTSLIDNTLKAKEYLKGQPFSLDIFNYNVDSISVDSYIIDSKEKSEDIVLPDPYITKGESQSVLFKANRISESKGDFIFEAINGGKKHKIFLKYEWIKEGQGRIQLSIDDEKTVSGNLFKRIILDHNNLYIIVMGVGPRIQISFGKP
ncbi:hypothetical protein [Photobacterium minamisatsumaniensis]|uniref:hypothetical protein n=1 Tax=Photobacterium minamisatsumaniensis TaxID=2910233 RepID=UPI003D13F15A